MNAYGVSLTNTVSGSHAHEVIGKKRKREVEEKVSTLALKRRKIAEEEQALHAAVEGVKISKKGMKT